MAGSVSRRHARPGTLDRALDALEMDDSVFNETTRTGDSLPRPELMPAERTDVQLPEPRPAWNEDDTNPGGSGARRGS
jgi:hypothetical protein